MAKSRSEKSHTSKYVIQKRLNARHDEPTNEGECADDEGTKLEVSMPLSARIIPTEESVRFSAAFDSSVSFS